MSTDLTDRVALITGASSGIGAATALAFAKAGVKLVLVARRQERLEQLAEQIRTHGADVLVLSYDLRDESHAREAVAKTIERFGQLDILVNNAGVMLLAPIAEADTSDWKQMVDINLLGLMYLTHAALPHMRERRSGHIVNISSVAGRSAAPRLSGYNATKWGVNGFSEALRREVHMDKIRVTVVEPGIVATELTDHITHEPTKTDYEGRVAEMEPLESEDIAAAILYAVSQPLRVNVNEILIRPLDQG